MPRSRTRRQNRGTTARAARSARAQARQAAELFGPMAPEQMLEAEGYLIEAIGAKIAQFDAEIAGLYARLAELPPSTVNTAAHVEATALHDEIHHIDEARAELDQMLDAVRNRRHFSVPGTLGVMVVRGASRALLAEAERLGVEVDAAALAEAKRREMMISRWLMNFEGTPETASPLGETLTAPRALPPAPDIS